MFWKKVAPTLALIFGAVSFSFQIARRVDVETGNAISMFCAVIAVVIVIFIIVAAQKDREG